MSIYRISKSLLVPLHTPEAIAREGMKKASDINASSPAISPPTARRRVAPMLTSKVTINPASYYAGSCLNSKDAEENVI